MILRRVPSFLLSILLVSLTLASPSPARAVPPGSEFTFQGELRAGGVLVNGVRDLRFRLYDAEQDGSQVGPQESAPGTLIVNGRFTVQLDFGFSPFVGEARWLEIAVSDGFTGPPFTTLAPRQALTAAPYALYALNGPAGPPGPPGPPGPVGIVASVDAQFSQDDRSGWVHVETLGDDSCFTGIPLGFTFTGWGRANTTVSVSSNGLLFFGSQCTAQFTNTVMPTGISGDPFLAFFWDDLRDYGAGEFFEYATFGSPGGRVFNLYFHNRLFTGSCVANPINLMISIHEGTNLVRVTYSGFTGCPEIRGSSATFGLQGPGGGAADAFLVSFDAPILDDNAPRQSMSYQPPP